MAKKRLPKRWDEVIALFATEDYPGYMVLSAGIYLPLELVRSWNYLNTIPQWAQHETLQFAKTKGLDKRGITAEFFALLAEQQGPTDRRTRKRLRELGHERWRRKLAA